MSKQNFLAGHLIATVILILASVTAAHEYKAGDITIGHPYAFASIGKVPNGAGFLTLENAGEADALIGVTSDFAARNELHTHLHEDGRMMMRPVEKIELPAGETVKLEPGGLHLMLMGLKAPLKAGEKKTVTLIFEKAGEVDVELSIEERGSGAETKHDGHGEKKP
ncbi:copper chaperone PCu(A)C [Minwuia sp.]|uniref:copper chaperone PCu(A)C n=1 Tax=Minwuia sp. TaxID=2493630 RepID=UPI003A939A15